MSAQVLKVSPTLNLPLDVATETTGILGKKGAGKSSAEVRLAEQMYHARIPWVAIDPKGDWWGVRSSADGKKPGLAVVVFGGSHGDVPLEPTAGALVADLVLGEVGRGYLSCVLDVSQFTITEQRKFLQAFGDRLFRQKDTEGVLHLFLEEAHEYLPQQPGREMAQLVSTWQRIVKQGRFKGLGVTVASQRSAALNKDVLTQVDSLICMRMMSPQDRAAVKGWVEVHVGGSDILKTLHELALGEAWMWSPDRFPEPQRFRFYQRETFDSGATPKVGEVRRAPATLADVDLAAIKEAMAAFIEKAKQEDVKVLQKRIAELERELARVKVEEVRVEVPVLSTRDLTIVQQFAGQVDQVRRIIDQSLPLLVARLDRLSPTPVAITGRARTVDRRDTDPKPQGREVARVKVTPAPSSGLSKAQRAMLSVLVQHDACDDRKLGYLAGYAPGSGHFNNVVGSLRTAGLIEGPRSAMQITQEGRSQLGPVDPLPTGQALIDYWLGKLAKAQKAMLTVLIEAYPGALTDVEVGERAGYAAGSGHFNNTLGRLRSVGLVLGDRSALAVEPTIGEAKYG